MTIHDDPLAGEILQGYVRERRDVEPDWSDVLRRTELTDSLSQVRRSGRRRRTDALSRIKPGRRASRRRGLLIAVAVIAATAGSSLAISAENNWWFLSAGAPNATSDVIVATTGAWGGHDWTLTAYRAQDEVVCLALTPQSSTSTGRDAANGCADVGQPASTRRVPITFLYSPVQADFPAYIDGAVIEKATRVRIELADGSTIETETIAAPTALDLPIRFYAAELPSGVKPVHVIGVDNQNTPVARVDFPVLSLPKSIQPGKSPTSSSLGRPKATHSK